MNCVRAEDQATFVGKLVETAISQSDVLVTLSTAVLGGLLALVLQMTIHNRGKDSQPIILPSVWWIVGAGGLLGISIVAGYLVQGGYVNNLSVLYGMQIDCSKVLLKHDVGNLTALARAAEVQFWAFFAGVIVAAIYLLRASSAAFGRQPPLQNDGNGNQGLPKIEEAQKGERP